MTPGDEKRLAALKVGLQFCSREHRPKIQAMIDEIVGATQSRANAGESAEPTKGAAGDDPASRLAPRRSGVPGACDRPCRKTRNAGEAGGSPALNAPGAFARKSAEAMPVGPSVSGPALAANAGLDAAAAPLQKAGDDSDEAIGVTGHPDHDTGGARPSGDCLGPLPRRVGADDAAIPPVAGPLAAALAWYEGRGISVEQLTGALYLVNGKRRTAGSLVDEWQDREARRNGRAA